MKMQFGSVVLYYNNNKGFIIGSESPVKGSIIRTIVHPVSVKKGTISDNELGNAILEGLDKSRTALPTEQIGITVKDMLSQKSAVQSNKLLTFNTIFGNLVKYVRPNDDFIDIGDGHTDAYQIYAYEKDDRNFIAFLIDSGYLDYTENAIKKDGGKLMVS